MQKLTASLKDAYCSTNYCISLPGKLVTLRIGEFCREVKVLMAQLDAQGAVFVTAWNPLSKISRSEENAAANERLLSELKGLTANVFCAEGVSADGKWREDSFFAVGVGERQARDLCVRYGQNAVVFIHAEGVPCCR